MHFTPYIYLMPDTEFVCLRTSELSPRNLSEYQTLFQAVFGNPKPAGLFERQFLPGPEQPGYHALLLHNGQIQGSYSAIPLTFINGTQNIQAALVVDALVHPDFQGKGYLRHILATLYQRMQHDGFWFLYGMPNSRFYPLLTGPLGWKDLGQMDWFALTPLSSYWETPVRPYVYRLNSPGFEAYRFKQAREKGSPQNRYWLAASPVPGFPLLLDWEDRNPAHFPETLKQIKQQTPFGLMPLYSPGLQGGWKFPDWVRGGRTRVAAYALSPEGETVLDSLWLTLADFDILP